MRTGAVEVEVEVEVGMTPTTAGLESPLPHALGRGMAPLSEEAPETETEEEEEAEEATIDAKLVPAETTVLNTLSSIF